MKHQDKYDELCRVLTDYEGYGTDDEDEIGDIDYVNDCLHELADIDDMNTFVRLTIQRTTDDNNDSSTENEIYDLACRCQCHWDDLWVED